MRGFALSTQVLSAAGASVPVVVLPQSVTASLPPAIICNLSSGASMTFNVEITGDDVMATGYNSATGNWAPMSTMTGLTGSAQAALGVVITGIRVNITNYGSGALTFQFPQANGQPLVY